MSQSAPALPDTPSSYRGTRLLAGLDALLAAGLFVLVASIPIENLVYVGPAALSRVAAVPVMLVFVALLLLSRRITLDTPVALAICAFLTWVVLSYFWSYSPATTLRYAITYLQLAVLVVIVWQACRTGARVRLVLAALATGGAVGSVLSLLQRGEMRGPVPRYSIGDPNDFGIALGVTVMASLHLAVTGTKTWPRLAWLAISALQVLAVFRTASRTALVAMILGLLVMAFHEGVRRPLNALLLVGTTVAAYGVAAATTDSLAVGRLSTTASEVTEGDISGRAATWTLAISYWNDVPLQGLGAGAYRHRSAVDGGGTAVHSVYVGLLSETGLVGAGLFLLILGLAAARLLRAADRAAALTLTACAVVWAIGALTLTLEIRKVIWLLVAMAASEGVVLARTRRRTPGPPRGRAP